MNHSTGELRLGSGIRSGFIAVLIGIYGWITRGPAGSLTVTLLIAAGVQLVVIALRRFVPADRLPAAMHVYEYIADGITVFLFALGVFGGIARSTEMAI
jgi:hypothetical protein